MNLESRKLILINWISSLQEDEVLSKLEKIQEQKADWWNQISEEDKRAINEGLGQLDQGEFLTRDLVRTKIKERFNF
tara:strand:- start:572 stop:802 length:231 start_codon:yes stop_codon:yes gene_type:complete